MQPESPTNTTDAGQMFLEGFRRSVAVRPDAGRAGTLERRLAGQTLGRLFSRAGAAEELDLDIALDRLSPEETMRVAMRFMDLAANAATEQAELRYMREELAAARSV